MNIHFSSKKTEWKTPVELLEKVYALAPVDLDPCCSDKHVRADRHYIWPEADGLEKPWSGVVYMNPPYGRQISAWCEKAADEAEDGAVVVGLLPARVDTRWFQEQVFARARAIVFVKGRLTFEGAEHSAPFPSCLVLWGGDNEILGRFVDVLGPLGHCEILGGGWSG